MGTDTRTVRGLVQAHLDTLRGLSQKERASHPSVRSGTEFNKLLGLAKEAAPEVDPRVWPAPLTIEGNSMGIDTVFADFVDIETSARQILSLLSDLPSSRPR